MRARSASIRRVLLLLVGSAVALAVALPAPRVAGSADPAVGTFTGNNLTVRLQGSGGRYTGVLEREGRQYPAQAVWTGAALSGTFDADGHRFAFTASVREGVMTFVTGRSTYTLRREGGTAAPAPGPRGLPRGFQAVPSPVGSGEGLVAAFPSARSARALGREALAALGRYLDGPPRPAGGIADREDQRAELGFEGRLRGAVVTGVMLSRVHAGRGAVGIAFDHAERAPRTMEALLGAVEQAMPISGPAEQTRWHDVPLPDGSGALRLPTGFRITSAYQGAVDVAGPAGERIALGHAYPVVTPEGTITALGTRLEYPLVAPFTDPPTALRHIAPQLDRFTRSTNPGAPPVALGRILEGQEIPWQNGRAAFLHYEAQVGGVRPAVYHVLGLIAVMPIDQTQWLFYTSSVAAPADVFRSRLDELVQIWQSWKVADHVFRQRMQSALQSMREAHRMIQEAHANREKVFAKANAKWSEVFRGQGRLRDTSTDRDVQISIHDLQDTRDALNRQAGYDKWVIVPPGEP